MNHSTRFFFFFPSKHLFEQGTRYCRIIWIVYLSLVPVCVCVFSFFFCTDGGSIMAVDVASCSDVRVDRCLLNRWKATQSSHTCMYVCMKIPDLSFFYVYIYKYLPVLFFFLWLFDFSRGAGSMAVGVVSCLGREIGRALKPGLLPPWANRPTEQGLEEVRCDYMTHSRCVILLLYFPVCFQSRGLRRYGTWPILGVCHYYYCILRCVCRAGARGSMIHDLFSVY